MQEHPYITPEIAQQMALQQVSDVSNSPFAELSERELQGNVDGDSW